MSGDKAWVTLATNDSYALGALVLARSLRRVNSTGSIVVMITPGVTGPMRDALSTEFDLLNDVNVLDSEDSANLALLERPELGITFTKLHCWKLTQFSKCVFLDADTLVLQNCDELFDRQEFSAAPDVGWPDCFNSGVFVFKPSDDTYTKLISVALSSGSFDGGDQGLLNLYFNDWSVSDISRHLPFIYNMVASASYSYLPAFKVFGGNVKIVHFIGAEKPWLMYFDSATGRVRAPSGQEHLQELLQAWWDIFRADVHRKLSPEMEGANYQSATMVEQVQDTFSHIHISDQSASSNFPFSSTPTNAVFGSTPQFYPRVPETQAQPNQSSQSNFHWISVAIERHPPEPHRPPRTPSPEPTYLKPNVLETVETSSQESTPTSYSYPSVPVVEAPSQGSSSREKAQKSVRSRKSKSIPRDYPRRLPKSGAAGLAGAFAKMSLEGTKSSDQIDYEEHMRKHAWEQGHIDYLGKDSFDNIMKKIQASIAQTAATPEPEPEKKAESPPKVTEPPKKSESEPKTIKTETASPPVHPMPTADELEEARLATERLALEKKLAEQRRIAEQKLQEEKQAAEARAAASAAAAAAAAAKARPSTTSRQSSTEASPAVPPRRQSKELDRGGSWRNVRYGVGVGLSCLAVVAFAIYHTSSASSTTSSLDGEAITITK